MDDVIIYREVPAEQQDWSLYFDGDGFTRASGNRNDELYIEANRNNSGFNNDKLATLKNMISNIMDELNDNGGDIWAALNYVLGEKDDNSVDIDGYIIFKNNTKVLTAIKDVLKKRENHSISYYYNDNMRTAEFLTIISGKEWKLYTARGYSQNDWADMIYCTESYKSVKPFGDAWFGCGKEFVRIEGEYECYGYFVTDSEASFDTDIKAFLEKEEGSKIRLELIENEIRTTSYEYRTV